MTTTLAAKLENFRLRVETEQVARLIEQGFDPERHNVKVTIKPGSKFVKVDVGTSGKYMVEVATGNIFGIKGYGQVHKGHFYGTLDTAADYNWGDYYPRKIDGTQAMQNGANHRIPAITHAPEVKPEVDAEIGLAGLGLTI